MRGLHVLYTRDSVYMYTALEKTHSQLNKA
jgi:hypothetical protein